MAQSVYKLFLVHNLTEAYYQLSEEANKKFWADVVANTDAAGAKYLVTADAHWCNEAYGIWGIEEYADIQAVQKDAAGHEKIQQTRYIKAESILGTLLEGFQIATVDFPNPVYELWLVKNQANESWENLTSELRDHLFALNGALIEKYGGVNVIICETTWSNEEYSFFGMTAWPNIEAEQAHERELAKIHWHRYMYGKKILGTPVA